MSIRREGRYTVRRIFRRITVFDVVVYSILFIIMIIMLYPFLFMISISTSARTELANVTFFPRGFHLDAYRQIFSMPTVLTGYRNSVFYTSVFTFLAIIMTVLLAYPLSKKWLPGRSGITIYILITMFINGGMIPAYLLVSNLGLRNSMWAIILPLILSTWLMIITRTFFTNIPDEMNESAYVDGANEMIILMRIYLPLSKPIIAVLALYYAVAMWNSWFPAMIYLNDPAKYPVQLILRNMAVKNSFDPTDLKSLQNAFGRQNVDPKSLNYALTISVVLPIMFLYPFLQKYFVKGVMVGSLKG